MISPEEVQEVQQQDNNSPVSSPAGMPSMPSPTNVPIQRNVHPKVSDHYGRANKHGNKQK